MLPEEIPRASKEFESASINEPSAFESSNLTIFAGLFTLQKRKVLSEVYDQPASGREGWWRTYIRVRLVFVFFPQDLYNIDPLKPHFYIVKLGFTEVYIIFLISAQKHRLWVLVRTASARRF